MNAYPSPKSFDGQVLKMLQSGRRLTVLDCVREFGIPSLRESAYRLRRMGYAIQDERLPCQGDDHRPGTYKRFFLETPSNTKNTGGIL